MMAEETSPNGTILDKLVERLNQIAEDVSRKSEYQDDLEQEVADVATLLSGLEKIAGLLTDTFNDIDSTLLQLRIDQEKHLPKIQDTLATVSTILMNYPDVFVKLDVPTIKMFLENVDQTTLQIALSQLDAQILTAWHQVLLKAMWGEAGDMIL